MTAKFIPPVRVWPVRRRTGCTQRSNS